MTDDETQNVTTPKPEPTPRRQVTAADKAALNKEIKQSLSEGRLGKRQKNQRKLLLRVVIGVAVAGILYWAYTTLFTYQKGAMTFGLCKVFLELQVEYPPELHLSYATPFSKTVRLSYVSHDSYGQVQSSMMDCVYKQDPKRGILLDKVLVNRRQVDPEIIEKFNATIPTIYAFPPDLTYPLGLPDNIRALKGDK